MTTYFKEVKMVGATLKEIVLEAFKKEPDDKESLTLDFLIFILMLITLTYYTIFGLVYLLIGYPILKIASDKKSSGKVMLPIKTAC